MNNTEWTNANWNPVVGCTPVPDSLTNPLHWRKPRMVSVCATTDLFHEDVPFEFIDKVFAVMALCRQHTFQVLTKRPEKMAEYFARPWAEIGWDSKAETHHGYEGSNIYWDKFVKEHGDPPWPADAKPWPLPNIWLGTSVENQQCADERIPHLLRCPAAVRFLSCEPLLGPISLTRIHANGEGVTIDYGRGPGTPKPLMRSAFNPDAWYDIAVPDEPGDSEQIRQRLSQHFGMGGPIGWIIVGGEGGKKARPCDVAWIRTIVEQCKAAGVPCFVKQLGAEVRWNGIQGGYMDGTPNTWPRGTKWEHDCGGGRKVLLKDSKGGDPSEWPEDLRVRQWLEVRK